VKKLKIYLDTSLGVKSVNALMGYKEILICQPTVLVSGDDENEE
jgi:hypothetical protein